MPRQEENQNSDAITFEQQLLKELDAVKQARVFRTSEGATGSDSKAETETEEGSPSTKDPAEGAIEAKRREAYDRAHAENLLGLAFSGGGIRSATFNLGVIQRLAKLQLLHRVDYLSTVSGGGYIGGWLSSWVHRQQGDSTKGTRPGILGVEDCLRDNKACAQVPPQRSGHGTDGAAEKGTPTLPEPRQVRWLREFSNYLTPRVGVLSTDTLSGVATYLRNLLLNQTILIAFGAALLLLPWVLVAVLPYVSDGWAEFGLSLAVLLLFAGSFLAGDETLRADLGHTVEAPSATDRTSRHNGDGEAQRAFYYRLLFGCFAAAAAIAGILMTNRPAIVGWWWAVLFGGAYGVGTFVGWLRAVLSFKEQIRATDPRKLKRLYFPPLGALFAGAGLGAMVWLWTWLLDDPSSQLASALPAVALGPLVTLGAILFTITLHLGLAGRRVRESGRELWSTHGAHQLRFGVMWLVLAGSSLFGPLALMLVSNWVAALGGVTWVLTTVAGVLAGSGSTTGGREPSRISELVARIAPYVFILGILLAVSYGLYRTIWWQWSAETVSPREAVCEASGREPAYHVELNAYHVELRTESIRADGSLYDAEPTGYRCLRGYLEKSATLVDAHLLGLSLGTLVLMLVVFVLSWRVDINVFSFHMFYRNRIERCYMGASNLGRCPHPLTGLDPTDTPKLRKLVLGARADTAAIAPGSPQPSVPLVKRALNKFKEYAAEPKKALDDIKQLFGGKPKEDAEREVLPAQRPFPIINAALNITSARNLAWQERKAASFTFTPMYCGYEIRDPDGKLLPGYQPTVDYVWKDEGWISLGLPITISGAAASPNAGYHTSAATAFLMTVFNVRLGWWLQNPRYSARWQEAGPKWALGLLLDELFGKTTDESKYVYLSDGGHFENLGIYELVRRRCRYIIACDAGCDPKYGFEDLGNAVRKVQIDLGIDIDIDPRAIRPDASTGRSRFHCAVGRIHYERADPSARPGYLLYVKSSITADAPADVLQYAADHPDFPHETTTDQWYSESQFESYRKLGFHAAGSVLEDALAEQIARGAGSEGDLEEIFTALSERWYPPSVQVGASFSKYGEAVKAIFERVRSDESLRFLDEQIYPEWRHLTDAGREGQPARNPEMLPAHPREVRAGFYFCNSLLQLMENVYHDLNLEDQYHHPDNRGWMNLFRHWSWAGMLRVTWAISASMYGARFQRFCRRRLDLEVGEVCCGDSVPFGGLEDKTSLNILEVSHVRKLVGGCFEGRKDSLSIVQLSLGVIRPFEEEKGPAFTFPFAFALIDASPSEPELLYYRVRDHLRGIGLGRKGLAVLLEETRAGKIVELEAETQKSIETVIPEADYPALRRLWTSVVAAKEERDRGYGKFDRLV